MSNDPEARITLGEYATELRVAKGLDHICSPPGDSAMAPLNALKEQLLNLLIRVQRGEGSCAEAKAQSIHIQEKLSKAIWAVDDWKIQFASRN
jgi:hypothetical protein